MRRPGRYLAAQQGYPDFAMSLFLFLTVVQALVAAALVGIVLIQRSEGGGLGIGGGGGGGGGPGGLLSARGSADFLTRTTKWLAVVFVTLAIIMAAVAVKATSGSEIDDSLKRNTAPVAGTQQVPAPTPATAPAQPAQTDPLKNVAQ
jgi:preprotein translocase subunit SecG